MTEHKTNLGLWMRWNWNWIGVFLTNTTKQEHTQTSQMWRKILCVRSLCLRMMKMESDGVAAGVCQRDLSALCVSRCRQHGRGCWVCLSHAECFGVKTGTGTPCWHNTLGTVTVFLHSNCLHVCVRVCAWHWNVYVSVVCVSVCGLVSSFEFYMCLHGPLRLNIYDFMCLNECCVCAYVLCIDYTHT